jgi:hypothetical protein
MQSDDVLRRPGSLAWHIVEARDVYEQRMHRPRIYANMADAELLALSADGDRCASDAVVIRYGPYPLRAAVSLCQTVPSRKT